MNFAFTPEQERFRREVLQFLTDEITPELRQAIDAGADGGYYNKEFSRKVGARGWIGLSWPKDWGGQGIGHMERLIYYEEMTRAQAPWGYHFFAERQMGPSIIMHGTDQQRRDLIPAIVRGELSFCIGYSEPGAGSDLAGLQTSATADGDDFVINGQKMYTSGAHTANYMWLAARTNPAAPKHKGISMFLVEMDTPGVTVRPLPTMESGRLNEVFFDNARVPSSSMVGELNQGWYVVAANLDFERSGLERIIANERVFERFLEQVRANDDPTLRVADNSVARHRLAEIALELRLGRLLAYRVAWLQSRGEVPNYEASVTKLFGGEMNQRASAGILSMLGLSGGRAGDALDTPLGGRALRWYLGSISNTIAGGSSEVLRNIIATRGLGLPR